MEAFGDADRPLWNTEFGVDAGNFVGAVGIPMVGRHLRRMASTSTWSNGQWQACLDANRELGLYGKLLPYQFAAGNERDDDRQIRQRDSLPPA